MPLPIYTSAAFTNGSGVSVASNASVEVRRESDGSLVPIFEDRDGQNQITQPGFQADLEGRFEFYAEPSADGWEITVTAGGDTHTLNGQFPQGGVFGIPEGERTINSQELLAAVSEAADVDEAVSFVGRGAIVESGTNANGSFVRWENGEQVCFGSGLVSHVASNRLEGSAPMPSVFVSDATTRGSISLSNLAANASFSFVVITGLLCSGFEASQVNRAAVNLSSKIAVSGDELDFDFVAWGFWK